MHNTKYDRPEKQDTAVSGRNLRYTRGSSVTASAGKTAGNNNYKQGKKQAGKRVRKPLTDEQRKRKNEKARIKRMLKRMDPPAAKTMSDEDRRRIEAMNRLEFKEHQRNGCVHCSPQCRNYGKCKGYARTEGLPKLHKVAAAPSCLSGAPVTPPQQERHAAGSVFDRIAEWVRGKLDTVRDTRGCSGVVSEASFDAAGGRIDVKLSVSRKSSGASEDLFQALRAFRPGVSCGDGVSPMLLPPSAIGRRWLFGIDPGHPSEFDRLYADIDRVLARDWEVIRSQDIATE